MVLTMTVGASVHHGISQNMIAIKNPAKLLQKLKGTLHVASRGKWQLDYKTPGQLFQYYSHHPKGDL